MGIYSYGDILINDYLERLHTSLRFPLRSPLRSPFRSFNHSINLSLGGDGSLCRGPSSVPCRFPLVGQLLNFTYDYA